MDYPYSAWYFRFHVLGGYCYYGHRGIGFLVRPERYA